MEHHLQMTSIYHLLYSSDFFLNMFDLVGFVGISTGHIVYCSVISNQASSSPYNVTYYLLYSNIQYI